MQKLLIAQKIDSFARIRGRQNIFLGEKEKQFRFTVN